MVSFLRKIILFPTLALIFLPFGTIDACSADYDEHVIRNTKGQTVFLVHFYNMGSRLFSTREKQIIKDGFEYWGRIFQKPLQGNTPIIALSTESDGYASYGGSQNLLETFSGGRSSELVADGMILIGGMDKFSYFSGPRSHHIPLEDKFDLRSLIVHELAHGFFGNFYGGTDPRTQRFLDEKTGNFGGPSAHNVNDVLEVHKPGADLKQIPLKNKSHIELERSLMSNQNYRNYSIFMEAELALLQDVGWSIDRRNFFGYSLYRNGQTVINENGYFARNPEGTAYVLGTYNQEPDGVGLHIYGNRNHVTQKANILTQGTRAVGARVDGLDNTLVIDKDAKVHVNGSDGIGVLFAHGKDHKFVLEGEVEAKGERGVGLSFDFGGNALGRTIGEQGSHVWTVQGVIPDKTHKMWHTSFGAFFNNPLATSVTIKGTLKGAQQSIYMSQSAFVGKITITPHARVSGDIVSEYRQKTPAGSPYLTSLIFGPENPKDTVEGQKFIYTNNIHGKNLEVHFTGPYTALYGGQHQVYRATIAPGAILGGNSSFAFESPEGLSNSGTLSPSSAESETFTEKANIGTLTIDGVFQQTRTGKLVIDVSKKGESDLLYATKKIYLDGVLEVRPERMFFSSALLSKNITFLKSNEGIQGNFSQIISPKSPTLNWNISNDDTSYVNRNLEASRASNAYSQYGTNINEQSVGRVLDRVVDKADKPLQSLYEELDFSSPDGSEVRSALAQLPPVAYGGAFGISLKREQQISDTLNERPSSALTPGQWQAFALPFVSQTNSKTRELQVGTTMRTTGLIAGIEHQTSSTPGLAWGFHGVVGNKASLTLNTADNAHGSLQAWGVGLQLRYQPDLLAGPYLSAQARMGLEQGTLIRTLAVNSYKGMQTGKWQGVTATTSVLGGTLWKVHDHLSIGPLIGLDYTLLTHPKIMEKGPAGISMVLEKTRHHSLQSSLGVRGIVSMNKKLKVDLQARWDRELLNTTLTQKARFAHISDSAFITKTRVAPRDALTVSGQATYELSPTVTLGARASAQFARSQKPDLIGNLSLNMKF